MNYWLRFYDDLGLFFLHTHTLITEEKWLADLPLQTCHMELMDKAMLDVLVQIPTLRQIIVCDEIYEQVVAYGIPERIQVTRTNYSASSPYFLWLVCTIDSETKVGHLTVLDRLGLSEDDLGPEEEICASSKEKEEEGRDEEREENEAEHLTDLTLRLMLLLKDCEFVVSVPAVCFLDPRMEAEFKRSNKTLTTLCGDLPTDKYFTMASRKK